MLVLGIVTVSDRASSGTYQDEGGPAVLAFFEEGLASPSTVHYRCVADEQALIEQTLIELSDDLDAMLLSQRVELDPQHGM